MSAKLSRIRELSRRLLSDGPGDGEGPSLDHLQHLTSDLRGPAEGIVRLTRCARTLGVSGDGAPRRRLVSTLQALRDTLRQDPGAVGQGTGFSQFKQALVDYNTSVRDAAEVEWSRRRTEIQQAAPEAMLSFWETIPDLKNDVAKVRGFLAKLEQKGDVLADPEKLERLLAGAAEIEPTLARLDGLDAPPAVQSFLKSARISGARWGQFTDEVRDWLEDHEMLENLRIRLG
jgi:hypothetical protein